jgi:hypothetical protein
MSPYFVYTGMTVACLVIMIWIRRRSHARIHRHSELLLTILDTEWILAEELHKRLISSGGKLTYTEFYILMHNAVHEGWVEQYNDTDTLGIYSSYRITCMKPLTPA